MFLNHPTFKWHYEAYFAYCLGTNSGDVVFAASRESSVYWVLQHEAGEGHFRRSRGDQSRCKGLQLSGGTPGSGGGTPGSVRRVLAESQAETFRLWIEHACPWHMRTIRHACHMSGGFPVVQCPGCSNQPKLVPTDHRSCVGCTALASSCTFVQKVATWSFRLDLVKLLHATRCGDDSMRATVLSAISSAQYRIHCECTVGVVMLQEASYDALYAFAAKIILSIPGSCRNQAAQDFLHRWTCWLPRTKLSNPHTELVRRRMNGLLPGTSCSKDREGDTKLASLILNGVLSGSSVIRTLVSALLAKCEREKRGKSCGVSSLPKFGIDHADICEAVFTLTSAGSQKCMLHMFGLNQRAIPRAPCFHPPQVTD